MFAPLSAPTQDGRRPQHRIRTTSPQALSDFIARFEPPADDEHPIVYTGDADAILQQQPALVPGARLNCANPARDRAVTTYGERGALGAALPRGAAPRAPRCPRS